MVEIAIVLNIFNTRQELLGSVEACAFVRHAFGCFYRDFAQVDLGDRAFIPVYTFSDLMENYKKAVMAYGETLRLFKTHRNYTGPNRKKHIPQEALERFPALIQVNLNTYEFTITAELEAECNSAKAAAEARRASDRLGPAAGAAAARRARIVG